MDKKNNQNVEHIMTTICNSASVDAESNNLSLFNIIEEITMQDTNPIDLKQKKSINLPFELISVWRKLDESKEVSSDLKIVFYDPNNNLMQEIGYKLEIKNPHQRMRIRIKGNGLNVTRQGNYYFSILIKNNEEFEEVARVPVFVKIIAPVLSDIGIMKK